MDYVRYVAPKGSALAMLRQQVHAKFDPLWEFGVMSRSEMYRRLAKALGIPQDAAHIGMFDEHLCRRALAVRNSDAFSGDDAC